MEKPTLVEVKRKFREWRKNNGDSAAVVPRRLKREAIHLLDAYSKATLAKALGVNETAIRAWQRRILEIEHDAGVDTKMYEVMPKKSEDQPSFFELGGQSPGLAPESARPSLMLRRPDGGLLSVKGDLTVDQIRKLTLIFLGGGEAK